MRPSTPDDRYTGRPDTSYLVICVSAVAGTISSLFTSHAENLMLTPIWQDVWDTFHMLRCLGYRGDLQTKCNGSYHKLIEDAV